MKTKLQKLVENLELFGMTVSTLQITDKITSVAISRDNKCVGLEYNSEFGGTFKFINEPNTEILKSVCLILATTIS